MRNFLIILFFFPMALMAQTPRYQANCGEYQNGIVDLTTGIFGTAGAGGATGASSGYRPGLLTAPSWPSSTPFVKGSSSCLHSQHVYDSAGNEYATGINDNLSLGLGPSAGSQGTMVKLIRDSAGNSFGNVIKTFDGANGNGSFSLAIKVDGTLWGMGDLQGLRGNGTNSAVNSGYPVQITGISAGDSVIDVKAGVIIMCLTRNGSTYKVYTSGGNSAFTGNGSSDYLWHVLSLSFMPKQIDMGVYWSFILGTNGNLYGWGWYQGIWANTLSSSPTVPTNIMSYIGMPSGSINIFEAGDAIQYAIDNSGQLWSWGDNITGALGTGTKIIWQNYGDPPLYGSTKLPWAWDQNQQGNENPVPVATKVDSCHTYIAVWPGKTYGLYTLAERSDHTLMSCGRNKGGVQGNGIYDGDDVLGGIESSFPNSHDTSGMSPIYPYNDAAGIASPAPPCSLSPWSSESPCTEYSIPGNAAPTISGWGNVTISGTSYAFSPTITPASGRTIANVRVTEIGMTGCPVTSISAPYSATTTISGVTTGTQVRITVTDDHAKQTTATATITVSSISANAGSDLVINLPTSSATLNGTASTGATTYLWTKISGPGTTTITGNTTTTPTVSGLQQGTYIFQLSINSGASTDQVQVTVNAAIPITNTLRFSKRVIIH